VAAQKYVLFLWGCIHANISARIITCINNINYSYSLHKDEAVESLLDVLGKAQNL